MVAEEGGYGWQGPAQRPQQLGIVDDDGGEGAAGGGVGAGDERGGDRIGRGLQEDGRTLALRPGEQLRCRRRTAGEPRALAVVGGSQHPHHHRVALARQPAWIEGVGKAEEAGAGGADIDEGGGEAAIDAGDAAEIDVSGARTAAGGAVRWREHEAD